MRHKDIYILYALSNITEFPCDVSEKRDQDFSGYNFFYLGNEIL